MNIIPIQTQLKMKEKHIDRVLDIDNAKIVNIQLRKGEMIVEHGSRREVIIVVQSGSVVFNVEGEDVTVVPGTLLHMKPLERHSLKAVDEECDILVFQINA